MITFEKAFAKVNLILNVGRSAGGYHELDSVVTTVNLYDTLIVKSRRDKKINLNLRGVPIRVFADYEPERDNAFKAAKLYCEKTCSNGVDITLRKNIPFSSGMGGSSTDAAAVLRAMERIYKKGADLEALANELGSDTAYLLNGGACRLKGRGEIITPIEIKNDFYLTVAFAENGVDTAQCFKKFDELSGISCCENTGESAVNGHIDRFIESLAGDTPDFSLCKNDLYAPACTINGEVKDLYEKIKSLSPDGAFMTGSGSTVCAIFQTRELCDWATEKMIVFGYKAKTLKTTANDFKR